MRFYVASKTSHAARWRELRDQQGYQIVSSWIDLDAEGAIENWGAFWVHCVEQVKLSPFLLAAHFPEDGPWKGAFVEIGAALASGVNVIVVGSPPGTWIEHPLVTAMTLDRALEFLR